MRIRKRISIITKIECFLVAIVLCAVTLPCVEVTKAADETETTESNVPTVTVAYIDYADFIEESQNGTYTGYGVDYLARIAQYTGWRYEFVEMSRVDADRSVKEGVVDFCCVARQTEERQGAFDFSLYPICSEEMNLYTQRDNAYYYEDYQAFEGMRVGILAQSDEIDCFKEYALKHDFSYTLIEYSKNEDAIHALEAGEVDTVALVNYAVSGEYKLVGNFGVAPAYLMSCQNSTYMTEFNDAQEQLYFDDPAYVQTLEQIYYGDQQQYHDLLLTREEAEFLAASEPLTVAISLDMAPIEYYDPNTDTYHGVSIDLYKRIEEITGLQFQFVQRMDQAVLISQMESGDVQLVGAMAHSESVAKNLQLIQTDIFSDNSMLLVTKDATMLTADCVVAVPDGYPMFVGIANKNGYYNTKAYATFEECVSAVYDGAADLTYIISMCEGYLLDHVRYNEMSAFPTAGSDYGICFGVYKQYDPRMLSILNKCLSSVTSHEINEMIAANTAIAKPAQTFSDFLLKNGVIIVFSGVLFAVLLAVLMIRLQKSRQRKELNRKLQQHHDFLQHIFDTLPCGVIQYSYEKPHRILAYNVACAKLRGISKEVSVIGKTPDVMVENGTVPAFQEKFDECEANRPILYMLPVTCKDGSRIYTESVMDLVDADDGKVFQEIIIDVTERTLTEQLIEKRYSNELERSDVIGEDLLYFTCFDVTEQCITTTTIDILGIRSGMSIREFVLVLQQEFIDLQYVENMEQFIARFTPERLQADYDNGHFKQSFDLHRTKRGQIQWLRSELNLRLNPKNGHLMCFDYIRDITDEHVTNEIVRSMALTDCESLMSIYLKTGHCLQYTVESNGELSRTEAVYGKDDLLSRLYENMTESDAKKLIVDTGLNLIQERLIDNDWYQIYATLYGETEARQDKAIRFFYTDKDNGVLAVMISDITEARASEVHHARLLADALAAAEKADVAKSRFLSRMSHEIRTPLNAVIGYNMIARDEMVKAKTEAEHRQAYTKVMDCLVKSDIASKNLLTIINDVLDMSAIESDKLKLVNERFNLKEMIDSLTAVFDAQAQMKNVELTVRFHTTMDDWVSGDQMRINQILMNLLSNAVKFTPGGGKVILTVYPKLMSGIVAVAFEVKDTGIGIDEEGMKHLFEPFEQADTSISRRFGGTGLGLSITKTLVELMGGTIEVESEPNIGTTFTVHLTLERVEQPEKNNPSEAAEKISPTVDVDFSGARVLLVEDNKMNMEIARRLLTSASLCVDGVTDGQQAVKRFTESAPGTYKAILMDIQMPVMDGYTATKMIRASSHPQAASVPIFAMTAEAFTDNIAESKAAGMSDHIAKPIDFPTLFSTLKKYIK